ncbi:MAG: HEAT repeat domain-containing protein [Gaiellaceae bacterium MAG52_C11]|nr:HEAT repeat domain-containing protein [Candidatus Gaiellasilicea maunaloa]
MPTNSPVRLTPKLRELVAADRLGRPQVGRLTEAHAELLTLVARGKQGFDEQVSAPRALAALAAGRPEAALPVLGAVLADPDAPRSDRVAAARGLGVVATPDAEELLLRSARDRNPRVQQAVFAALGWFGSPRVARELGKIRPADAHARRQLELARALAVHRHGLDGPFLPAVAAARSRPAGRAKTTELSLRAKTPKATATDLDKVQGPLFGIAVAPRGYALQCGEKEWTVFVNKELDPSSGELARLRDRPWIAAVLCWWYPMRTIATTQYVLLTRPVEDAAHIDVVRSDGEIVFTGAAEPLDAGITFSIGDVQRASRAPVRLAGRLTPKGVELDVALAAPRRVGTRGTGSVAAG